MWDRKFMAAELFSCKSIVAVARYSGGTVFEMNFDKLPVKAVMENAATVGKNQQEVKTLMAFLHWVILCLFLSKLESKLRRTIRYGAHVFANQRRDLFLGVFHFIEVWKRTNFILSRRSYNLKLNCRYYEVSQTTGLYETILYVVRQLAPLILGRFEVNRGSSSRGRFCAFNDKSAPTEEELAPRSMMARSIIV